MTADNGITTFTTIYQDLPLLDPTQSADGYAATFPISRDLSTIGTGSIEGGTGGGPPCGTSRPGG